MLIPSDNKTVEKKILANCCIIAALRLIAVTGYAMPCPAVVIVETDTKKNSPITEKKLSARCASVQPELHIVYPCPEDVAFLKCVVLIAVELPTGFNWLADHDSFQLLLSNACNNNTQHCNNNTQHATNSMT